MEILLTKGKREMARDKSTETILREREFRYEAEVEHILTKVKWERMLKRVSSIDAVRVSGTYDFLENELELEIDINGQILNFSGEREWTQREFDEIQNQILMKMAEEGLIKLRGFKKN